MPRTTIAVDAAIADFLAGEASKQNKTLYGLTNESLTEVLEVWKDGGASKEVFPSWFFGRMLKDTDSVPVPGVLIEKMVQRLYAVDRKWLLEAMFEAGAEIGSYLKLRFPNLEDVIPRLFELQAFLPIRQAEFQELSATTERMTIAVRILGAGPSVEATECTQRFLKGILSQYPYKIAFTRIAEGIIEATITSKEKR